MFYWICVSGKISKEDVKKRRKEFAKWLISEARVDACCVSFIEYFNFEC